jgi:hypothetical protein
MLVRFFCVRDVSNVGTASSVRSTGTGSKTSQLGLPHGARKTTASPFIIWIIIEVHNLCLRACVHRDEKTGGFRSKIEAMFVASQRL